MDVQGHIATLFELEHETMPFNGVVGHSGTGRDVPRVTIYRHSGGHITFFRDDLPDAMRASILESGVEHAIDDTETVTATLASKLVLPRTTYYFDPAPELRDEPEAILCDERWMILVDGVVACEAWTAGENEVAATIRVDTLPEFRGRGYARQATAAWVAHVLRAGITPYYTHATDNHASRSLARSLGAVEFAIGVKYQ
jgi:GNAT superfamily N-acetyltransferase